MKIFREDPYKVHRVIWLVIGFSVAAMSFFTFVQKTKFNTQSLALLVVLMVALPLVILIGYYWEYLALEGEQLLITRVLWKEIIPIKQISSLSYEFTGRALMLFVHYEKDSAKKWKDFVVDYMSTDDIKALNEGVLAVNPRIEIKIDKLSKEAQERNAKNLRGIPTNVWGWIIFAAKWFGIGAAFNLILLFLLAPKK